MNNDLSCVIFVKKQDIKVSDSLVRMVLEYTRMHYGVVKKALVSSYIQGVPSTWQSLSEALIDLDEFVSSLEVASNKVRAGEVELFNILVPYVLASRLTTTGLSKALISYLDSIEVVETGEMSVLVKDLISASNALELLDK